MTTRLAVLLAGAVLLTACGSATSGGAGPVSGADPATPTTSEPSAAAAGFPVVIERRGGIAGFRDRVSVAADGTASVETKRGPQPGCRSVRPRSSGSAAPSRRSRRPAATTQAGVSDAMVVTVRAPGSRVHVVPDDPQEPVTVVSEVLTQATSGTCA